MTKCQNCRFYIPNTNEDGNCRRYPPKSTESGFSYFTEVLADWWCGEFKENPKVNLNRKYGKTGLEEFVE